MKTMKAQVFAICAVIAIAIAIGVKIMSNGGDSHDHSSENDTKHNKSASAKADTSPKAESTPKTEAATKAEPAANQASFTDAQIKAAAITTDVVGPGFIATSLQLPGEIRFNQDLTAHVVPRVSGIVESVHANLGQMLKQGQTLAVIASSTISDQRADLQTAQKRLTLARTTFQREKSLWEQKVSAEQDYLLAQQVLSEAEIAVASAQQKLRTVGAGGLQTGDSNRFILRAPFNGVVTEKHITLGEAVKEDAQVFTLSDLSSVWVEIAVPAKDLPLIKAGEKVVVRSTAFDASATGTVTYIGNLIGAQTRTATARVVVANPSGIWRPGLFVNVEISQSEGQVPLTVSTEAVQTLNNQAVVFIKTPTGFTAQPVKLGRSNGTRIEVVDGLSAGTRYAAQGSFVVKAELGKTTTEHNH